MSSGKRKKKNSYNPRPYCEQVAPWKGQVGEEIKCSLRRNHIGQLHYGGQWTDENDVVRSHVWAEDEHTITLERDKSDLNKHPWAQCTCGWSYSHLSSLLKIGAAAKKHSETTGHRLRGIEKAREDFAKNNHVEMEATQTQE